MASTFPELGAFAGASSLGKARCFRCCREKSNDDGQRQLMQATADKSTAFLPGGKLRTGEKNVWLETKLMGVIGTQPPNWASQLFQMLLNRSYGYLLSFIAVSLLSLTLLFSIPYVLLVRLDPGSIVGAETAADAISFAFASFFGVPTRFQAASNSAIIVATTEIAVGKLAVTGLTALLVLKISKTPNNIVVTERVLIHKKGDKWHLSIRAAVLYEQRLYHPKIWLSTIANTTGGWMPATLPWQNHCLGHGFGRLDGLPMNLRHCVDANSPLRDINFESEDAVKGNIMAIIIVIQGFDKVTGRSVGYEQRYDWDPKNGQGKIIYLPTGEMCDILIPSSKVDEVYSRLPAGSKKRRKTDNVGAVDWRAFNLIRFKKETCESVANTSLDDLEQGKRKNEFEEIHKESLKNTNLSAAAGQKNSAYAVPPKSLDEETEA